MKSLVYEQVASLKTLNYRAPTKSIIEKTGKVQYMTDLDRRLDEMIEARGPDFINALLDYFESLGA